MIPPRTIVVDLQIQKVYPINKAAIRPSFPLKLRLIILNVCIEDNFFMPDQDA